MGLGAVLRALSGLGKGSFLVVAILAFGSAPARAVPAFAAQTGQPCQACHVGGFGPQLTSFGREFKLGGYTTRADKWTVPFSAMAVASYLRTQKDQAAPPASGFRQNDNTALDQVSLFLAGGFGPHLGAFVQTTYDGIGRSWTWDNVDLRATASTEIRGAKVVWGASLNNNPTVQDAWNTTPAWGFPYTSSALAPSPAAAPLLAGALAQNTLGLTGYAWINSQLFLEGGAYGSPDKNTLTRLGVDPLSPGNIHGLAPYGRIAYQAKTEAGTFEVGAFGLRAEIFPGVDRTTGFTDRYTDLGVDASYQRAFENSDVLTLNARYIDEQQTLNATCALAGADSRCADNRLRDVRADVAYYWRNKIGATVGVFDTFGSANPILNSGNRTFKPDSAGVTLQLDGTPFGGEPQPARRANVRVGVQYTFYTRFNGARSNFDLAGTNAADNNTLRVFTWFAF